MIPIEIREKIFALYLNQKLAYTIGSSTLSNEGWLLDATRYYLSVTPLSQITDEDAISIANICYPQLSNENYLRIVNKGYSSNEWFPNIHESIYLIEVEIFNSHPDYNKWMRFSLLQIDTEDGSLINGEYSYIDSDFKDSPFDNHIYAIDYLRSKGYALPAYNYTVDQLIQEGIFQLKTETK